jgi:Ca2+-binding RTX toxin-like protein
VSGVSNLVYTGTGGASLSGSSAANSIDASAATSGVSLNGGTGKDTLWGGSGNDTLVGNGSAALVGGTGANTYIVSSAADKIADAGSGSVIRSSISFNLASALVSGVNNLVYTGSGNVSLLGNSSSNSIVGSSGKDTIQGWSGMAASNTASDTLTGGAGADSFILSTAGQSTNAYGNGSGAVANITDFGGGSTGDKLVLHNFGTGHVGSAGYQTVSGGAGILDVYTYQGTDSNNLVAHMTLASGTFAWTSNASFV